MAHDRRYQSREEEDYYYNQRSHSQGAPNGYYDNTQGNPYAYYSQPQAPPDYGRNGSYHEQPVARDRNKDRYYAESEEDDSSDDSRHRRPSHSSRSRSKKRDKSRDKNHDKEEPSNPKLEAVKKHFGASDQNYMASVLGMVAGGFLGGEAVKGDRAPLGVIGGALLGGLSANAIEKKREQIKERKEEEESSRDRDRRRRRRDS